MTNETCPECGALGTRATSSGLGGRWKVICTFCGHRFAECDGEEAGIAPGPATISDEEE